MAERIAGSIRGRSRFVLIDVPNVLVVHSSVFAGTRDEFVDAAKAQPASARRNGEICNP